LSDPVAEARLRQMLGPAGATALARCIATVRDAYPDLGPVEVRWAGWSSTDWTFTVGVDDGLRRFGLSVPHGSEDVAIRELDPEDEDA
jgi:hypothetical protein